MYIYQVPVPEYVTKARDVRVNITATNVNVAVKGNDAGEWKTLMEGELCWKTNKDESIWSLEPGRHVQVSDIYLQCLFLGSLFVDLCFSLLLNAKF